MLRIGFSVFQGYVCRVPLPNANRLFIDERKLAEYCLSPIHPRGKHKAKVFARAVGIGDDDVEMLRQALENAAKIEPFEAGEFDEFGQRYFVDFELHGPTGSASARSVWIIREGEDFPRLVSCYII